MKNSRLRNLLIVLFTIGLFTTSCSDDDSTNINNDDLIGQWQGETLNYSGTTISEIQGVSLVVDYVGTGYDIDYSITFNNELSLLSTAGSYSLELTTTAQGQSYTINEENLSFEAEGPISITGNEIIFDDGTVGTIVSVNDNFLELHLYNEETVFNGGFDATTKIDMNVTFTR